MDRELLHDIWRNPRSIFEIAVLPALFINGYQRLQPGVISPILCFFRFILVVIPVTAAKLIFLILPFFPSKNSDDESLCDSAINAIPIAIASFAITIFFSFGMTFLLANSESTTVVSTATISTYSFQDDWANRWLYLIVVPAYITLSVIIVFTSRAFQKVDSSRSAYHSDQNPKVLDGTRPKFARGGTSQLGVVAVGALIAAFWMATSYQIDVYNLLLCFEGGICNRTESTLLYWFLVNKGGNITYNIAGHYYIVLIFFLLAVVIISTLFYYSSAFSVVGLTKHIHAGKYDDFNVLYSDLKGYRLLFVYAKWLSLAFIVNTYIWKNSYLGDVQNLDVTIAAYAILASVILPIPNHILQASWNLRQRRRFLIGEIRERAQNCEIFDRGWIVVFKNSANTFIGLFFAISVIDLVNFIFGVDLSLPSMKDVFESLGIGSS